MLFIRRSALQKQILLAASAQRRDDALLALISNFVARAPGVNTEREGFAEEHPRAHARGSTKSRTSAATITKGMSSTVAAKAVTEITEGQLGLGRSA
jgi:hypothetical protein